VSWINVEVVVSECVDSGTYGPITWTEVLHEERCVGDDNKLHLVASIVAQEYHSEASASKAVYKVEVVHPRTSDNAVLYVKVDADGGVRHYDEFPS
jgi:hypothetical protein